MQVHVCGFMGAHVLSSLCALMLSTVWPSLVLPAVLTLVCVDSKHSCRSQRPRSGRTRGSEGQWGREHTGSMNAGKGKVELQGTEEEEEMVRKKRRALFGPARAPLLLLRLT